MFKEVFLFCGLYLGHDLNPCYLLLNKVSCIHFIRTLSAFQIFVFPTFVTMDWNFRLVLIKMSPTVKDCGVFDRPTRGVNCGFFNYSFHEKLAQLLWHYAIAIIVRHGDRCNLCLMEKNRIKMKLESCEIAVDS